MRWQVGRFPRNRVQATTAIEGNTLSTEQIRGARIEGQIDLPLSQGLAASAMLNETENDR